MSAVTRDRPKRPVREVEYVAPRDGRCASWAAVSRTKGVGVVISPSQASGRHRRCTRSRGHAGGCDFSLAAVAVSQR